MPTGKVTWFSPAMGYGFILPDDGSKEVFVHISAVKKAGLRSLAEGEQLRFDLVNRLGKETAQNLQIASSSTVRSSNASPQMLRGG
jgi:CspA family cold shock protein